MTQTELELGFRLKWIKHDPLGAEPILEAKFWWVKPINIQWTEVEGEQVPFTEEFETQPIGETDWSGTNDFGPLWAAIEAKKAELKTDN